MSHLGRELLINLGEEQEEVGTNDNNYTHTHP